MYAIHSNWITIFLGLNHSLKRYSCVRAIHFSFLFICWLESLCGVQSISNEWCYRFVLTSMFDHAQAHYNCYKCVWSTPTRRFTKRNVYWTILRYGTEKCKTILNCYFESKIDTSHNETSYRWIQAIEYVMNVQLCI